MYPGFKNYSLCEALKNELEARFADSGIVAFELGAYTNVGSVGPSEAIISIRDADIDFEHAIINFNEQELRLAIGYSLLFFHLSDENLVESVVEELKSRIIRL